MLGVLLQLGISMHIVLPTHWLLTSGPTCTLDSKTKLLPRVVATKSATENESFL